MASPAPRGLPADVCFVETKLGSGTWTVPERYANLSICGAGAFSDVCSASDQLNACQPVAIKKLNLPFVTEESGRQVYRELVLLKTLSHVNIMPLIDCFSPECQQHPLHDAYFVMPLGELDLAKSIAAMPLLPDVVKSFTYQMMCGINYLHASGVIHFDLNPANLVIQQSSGRLRIIDLGLARLCDEPLVKVTTPYYSPPEIVLAWTRCNETLDMWSAGCVVMEMITGDPLFASTDVIDHMRRVFKFAGSPSSSFLEDVPDEVRVFVSEFPKYEQQIHHTAGYKMEKDLVDFLERIFVFDTGKRLTARDALQHTYLQSERKEPDSEKLPTEAVVCTVRQRCCELDQGEWQECLLQEIVEFHETTSPQ